MVLYKQLDAALTEEERQFLTKAMQKSDEYQKELDQENATS